MTTRTAKSVIMPWRPIIGLAEGRAVRLGPGDYWEVTGATVETRRGARVLLLHLSPLEPAEVLTGFGEYIEIPPVELEEV